jgi:hypothetical protein
MGQQNQSFLFGNSEHDLAAKMSVLQELVRVRWIR